MKRPYINYIIDVGLAISFLVVAITGLFKWPGLRFGFNGPTMRTFTWLHDWGGALLSALVLIHIILHWKWIVVMTKNIFGKKKGLKRKKKK